MKARSRCLDIVPRVLIAALTISVLASAADAQDASASPGLDAGYVAVVTQDQALLLSGPHDSFYPFGRLQADHLVRVVDHRDRWARVQTIGPAFVKLFGYVRYLQDETGRMRIAGDGRSAVTMGEIDVLAPNLNAGFSPGASWKSLARLQADTTVMIVETKESDREIVHTVMLPVSGSGWMSLASLRRATPAEIDQWQAALAELELPAAGLEGVLAPDETPAPIITLPGDPVPPAIEALREEGLVTPVSVHPLPEIQPELEELIVTSDQVAEPAPADPTADDPASSVSETLLVSGDWEGALGRLEDAFGKLKVEPLETAEVMPLRELYLELARKSTKPNVSRFSEARSEQLSIWSEIQQRRQELIMLRSELQSAEFEASSIRMALEKGGPYVGVGRLAVSSIYDGRQLPRLLRIQDPTSGRTIAYVEPITNDIAFDTMIGGVVGIVGTKEYDGGLRVNLITPERVELLSAR